MGKIKLNEVNVGKLAVNDDHPVINVGGGDGKIGFIEDVHVAGVDIVNLEINDLPGIKIHAEAVHVDQLIKHAGDVHVAYLANLVFNDEDPLIKIHAVDVHVAELDLGNLVVNDDHPLIKIHAEAVHVAGNVVAVPIFAHQNQENLHGEAVILNNNHPNDLDLIGSDSDSDIEG